MLATVCVSQDEVEGGLPAHTNKLLSKTSSPEQQPVKIIRRLAAFDNQITSYRPWEWPDSPNCIVQALKRRKVIGGIMAY